MPKLLLIIILLPLTVLLSIANVEQDYQRSVYELVRRSANTAARDAVLQIDWELSSTGHYVIDQNNAERVFLEHFRENVGLDAGFNSDLFNGPVKVNFQVVNYDPADPFPREVSFAGFNGIIDESSVIAVIEYTRDSLIPGFSSYNARVEVVVQGQLGG